MRADDRSAKNTITTIAKNFQPYNVARNIVAGFLAAYGWVSFFCFIFLQQSWAALAPKTPSVTLGYIYRHNNHGAYTYFSSFQATTCALMPIMSVLLFVSAFAIVPKKNINATFGKASARWDYDLDDPTKIFWKAAVVGALFTPAFVFILAPHIVKMLNSVGVIMHWG